MEERIPILSKLLEEEKDIELEDSRDDDYYDEALFCSWYEMNMD